MVTSADEIDEVWLTTALVEAGVASSARVVSIEARSIGTGQVGENIRYTLSWSPPRPDLPQSVVVKCPSTDELSLATAAATSTYVREVGFYRDLRGRLPVPTPKIYRLEEDLNANQFLLLMADITPAVAGDQLAGCGLTQAELAVGAAADLHAATWGRGQELGELSWLEMPSLENQAQRVELYQLFFDGFVDRYRQHLSAEQVEVGRWIGEQISSLSEASLASTLCLVHGDYRLDNLLFGSSPAVAPITVVDWQTARIGPGPSDIAYFIGAGLTPDDRRLHELQLVDRYQRALRERGVDVESETIWQQYRLGSTTGYVMAVVASQIVGRTERGDEMFLAMATRHAQQIIDLDVATVIE